MSPLGWFMAFLLFNIGFAIFKAVKSSSRRDPSRLARRSKPQADGEDRTPIESPAREESHTCDIGDDRVFFSSFRELVVLEKSDGSRLAFGTEFPITLAGLWRRLRSRPRSPSAPEPARIWVDKGPRWELADGQSGPPLSGAEIEDCRQALRRGGRLLGFDVSFEGPGAHGGASDGDGDGDD